LAYLFLKLNPILLPVISQRSQRTRILFTSSLITSFIKEDLALLDRQFDVDHVVTRGILAPFLIARHVFTSDMTVLFARILGKPSIVVIGGVDASKEPEIRYGIWLNPWKALLVRWEMRNASKLLAVDPFFVGEIKRLAAYEGRNIECVPTGYDAAQWSPSGVKEEFVLTVAACHDELRMRKKGLDTLFAAARTMMDVRFVVVGILPDVVEKAKSTAPANVEIVSFMEQQELLTMYRRAKVYCQPSFTEGLPNSLCEAMLCECIPVGTNVGGIPSAIADIGLLVPRGDAGALSSALQRALQLDSGVGVRARQHIMKNFPLDKREASLVRIIHEAVT
jgi:glycosyltransferase involved in cell wall biosynthesis